MPVTQGKVDVDQISFRSAFAPVWQVGTMWTAMLAGGIIGMQAFLAGTSPPVPQLLLTAGAAVTCGIAFALAVGYYQVQVTAEGLRGYDLFGQYALARWEAITEVRPTSFLGLRYLRVFAEGTRRPRWLPLFLADMDGFAAAVSRRAGAEHPLVRALPREARRTFRGAQAPEQQSIG